MQILLHCSPQSSHLQDQSHTSRTLHLVRTLLGEHGQMWMSVSCQELAVFWIRPSHNSALQQLSLWAAEGEPGSSTRESHYNKWIMNCGFKLCISIIPLYINWPLIQQLPRCKEAFCLSLGYQSRHLHCKIFITKAISRMRVSDISVVVTGIVKMQSYIMRLALLSILLNTLVESHECYLYFARNF